ncbi:uracil-dna glycosylase [Vairimorpha apis BRL 01]|uniref:Uracil-DNA glycosylase n=1 Tax=Vairimorpha apis BRL 01 TaxID=1037528 RepID=T0MGQ8_9MICR|nr:uracil-dna glycosylase [Vairimorpha apis BRL 01]
MVTVLNETKKLCDFNLITNNCKCEICLIELLICEKWREILKDEFSKNYFLNLKKLLHSSPFFPETKNVFAFLNYFPIESTKIVIIGQDPYHGEGQATGLSFSVPKNKKIPPSLKNIFKELKDDIIGFKIPTHGNLEKWAMQGVLLINDVLTVEKNKPGSHSNYGWQFFTKSIIEKINLKCNNVVFMLWGRYAKSKAILIDCNRHLVLESAHPSPFSAKYFFNCKHFSKANKYLISHCKKPIVWNL